MDSDSLQIMEVWLIFRKQYFFYHYKMIQLLLLFNLLFILIIRWKLFSVRNWNKAATPQNASTHSGMEKNL